MKMSTPEGVTVTVDKNMCQKATYNRFNREIRVQDISVTIDEKVMTHELIHDDRRNKPTAILASVGGSPVYTFIMFCCTILSLLLNPIAATVFAPAFFIPVTCYVYEEHVVEQELQNFEVCWD